MPAQGIPVRRKIHLIIMRTTADLKAKLEAAAEQNGRSLTQEIESRLERQLLLDEIEGGTTTAAILASAKPFIVELEQELGVAWFEDSKAATKVRRVLEDAFRQWPTLVVQAAKRGLPSRSAVQATLTVRCTSELREKLRAAVTSSARSLNKEVEFRLERSLEDQEHTAVSLFLHILGARIHELELHRGAQWQFDAATREAVAELVRKEIKSRTALTGSSARDRTKVIG